MRSLIRDLVAKIETVARDHPSYSQVYDIVRVATDHMAARARVEELNQETCRIGTLTTRPKRECHEVTSQIMEVHQAMTSDQTMSTSAERAARADLDQGAQKISAATVRSLLADLDVWRDLATHNRDKWSFDALLYIGERLLAEVYPEKLFTGESGDSGPQYIVALRDALRRIVVEDGGARITWDAAGNRIVTPLR